VCTSKTSGSGTSARMRSYQGRRPVSDTIGGPA
jgi:hypothetical protein